MKLILECFDGSIFAYRESEAVFERNEPSRGTPLRDGSDLDQQCDLGHYDEFHMVFELLGPPEPKPSLSHRIRTKLADGLFCAQEWLRGEDNSLRDAMPLVQGLRDGAFSILALVLCAVTLCFVVHTFVEFFVLICPFVCPF